MGKTYKQRKFTFYWDDGKNSFEDQSQPALPEDSTTNSISKDIKDVLEKIQYNSGVKRQNFCLFFLFFSLLNIGAWVAAFWIIMAGQLVLGSWIIIITPMITYFGLVGPRIVQGTQVSRINNYMKKKTQELNKQLQASNFKVYHSFNVRIYITHFK